MDGRKAVTLLHNCKPLAKKVAESGGYGVELTDQDRAALAGFEQVVEAGFLNNFYIVMTAGLNSVEVQVLQFLLLRETTRGIFKDNTIY